MRTLNADEASKAAVELLEVLKTDEAARAEALALMKALDEELYDTPVWWQREGRPPWWRDEWDREIESARYLIDTPTKGKRLLAQTRDPEKYAADERAYQANRKLRNAPKKVAHYMKRVAYLEERVAALKVGVTLGCRFVKREDGSPYISWYQIEVDLHQAEHQLGKARGLLRDWQEVVAGNTPPVADQP